VHQALMRKDFAQTARKVHATATSQGELKAALRTMDSVLGNPSAWNGSGDTGGCPMNPEGQGQTEPFHFNEEFD